MKRSTKFWRLLLTLIFLTVLFFNGIILVVPILAIPIYIIFCFFEIYSPFDKKVYGNNKFEYCLIKAKYNIFFKINKLIDGK